MKKTILLIAISLIIILSVAGWYKIEQSNNEKEIAVYLDQRAPKDFTGKTSVEIRGLLPNEPSTDNIVKSSDLIVQGTIESIGQSYKTDQGEVYHNIVVLPKKIFKNNANTNEQQPLQVVVVGGEINGTVYWGLNIPSFKLGEEDILFLGEVKQEGLTGDYFVSYGSYGKLTIEGVNITGISHESGLVEMSVEDYLNKLQDIIAEQR